MGEWLYRVVVQATDGLYGTAYQGIHEPMARLIFESLTAAGHEAWLWSCVPDWQPAMDDRAAMSTSEDGRSTTREGDDG